MSQESRAECPAGTLDDGKNTFNHGAVFYKVLLSAKTPTPCYVDPNNTRDQPVKPPFCYDDGKDGWLLTASLGTELITEAEERTKVVCSCDNGTISCPICKYSQFNFSQYSGQGNHSSSVSLVHTKGLSCMASLINKTNSQIDTSYKKDALYDKDNGILNQSYGGGSSKNHRHLYGSLFTTQLWENIKKQSGLKVFNVDKATPIPSDAEIKKDNEIAQSMMDCVKGRVLPNHGMWQIGGAFSARWKNVSDGCISGSFYLDNNCKLVDKKSVGNGLCGSITYSATMATPISLIWAEDYADKPATIVDFKLDPTSNSNTWMWRGSESLPLLVYDPERTGAITSATQLFGNWTFGGNKLASLVDQVSEDSSWKNGFEALSMMDRDMDGKVSGEELNSLSLWFDKNQDGVSQVGEVSPVEDFEITALYYKASKDTKQGLIAEKGFDRMVGDKVVTGRSIDWTEKSLRDGFDVLLNSALLDRSKLSTSSSNTLSETAPQDSLVSDYSSKLGEDIAGVWTWELEGKAEGTGMFTFTPTEQGILGMTMTQVTAEVGERSDNRIIFSHFELKSDEKSSGRIYFNAQGEGSTILENSALLSEDKTTLTGKTVVKGSELANSGSYEYSWKAYRTKN